MTASRLWFLLALASTLDAATVRLVYVGPADGDAAAGVRQAVDEARLQGKFLGLDYELQTAESFAAAEHANAAAVFLVGDSKQAQAVAKTVDAPVFSLTDRDSAARSACSANLFHTAPTAAMLAAAEAQWKEAHPDDEDVEAHAWHPGFFKFSARELNRRFHEAQGRPMTGDAWTAWAAVKLFSDAVANNPDADSAELIRYLRQDMEFDGVKGPFLTFHQTGQLRQPLILTVGGELKGEAPVRGVAASDDLDSLISESCR